MNSLDGEKILNEYECEVEKIANSPELEKNRKDAYEKFDKCINGFRSPYEADNNEDYERKLRAKLADFVKAIDRPAFQKELVYDVKLICERIVEAFTEAKIMRKILLPLQI